MCNNSLVGFLMSATQNRNGIIIAGLFIVLGLGFSYYTPLWCPPDEDRHFAYCEYIAQNHTLPHLDANDAGFRIGQATHPPLYYLIGSFFCKADKELILQKVSINEGPGYAIITPPATRDDPSYEVKARSAYRLRMVSLVFSGFTIFLTFLLILNIFPGETTVASTGALLVATNPQLLHVSASVSNEPLNIMLATLYIFILINYLKAPFERSWQILAGMVLGLCLLTKLSAIIYVPITLLVVLWVCFRERKNFLGSLIVILSTAFLLSGWWYLRNWILYQDPVFSKITEAIHPWALRQQPLSLAYGAFIAKMVFVSFFGYFGSLQIPISNMHLACYGTLIIFGCAGICKLIVKEKLSPFQLQVLGLLFLAICAGVVFYLQMNIRYNSFMGRYLFVVIAPIAALIVTGLWMLVPVRWRNYWLIFIGCFLIVVNLDVLFRILKPAFAEPRLALGVDQSMFCCFKPAINDITTISQTFVSPGNKLCAIRAIFSYQSQRTDGDLVFVLKETGGQGKIVRQMLYPLRKTIKGIDRYFFIFPPIMDSRGKEYQVSFGARSVSDGEGISVGYDANDRYPGGRMFVNGEPAEGDLYFQTYCFSGDHPETDWEGRREVIMDQMYVSVRESQFYSEMSREFRKKTIIHEKLLQAEKAFQRISPSEGVSP